MAQSISALFVAALIIVSGVVMAGVTGIAIDKVDQSWRQMALAAEERLGT